MRTDQEPDLTPGERELEAVLRRLTPAPAGTDPVAAAFEAGRRSVARRMLGWRLATAGLAAALFVTAGISLRDGRTATPPRPVIVAEESPPPQTPAEPLPADAKIAASDEIYDPITSPPWLDEAGLYGVLRQRILAGEPIDSPAPRARRTTAWLVPTAGGWRLSPAAGPEIHIEPTRERDILRTNGDPS